MYSFKSGAQKRKDKKKRVSDERRGLQTLFQVGVHATTAHDVVPDADLQPTDDQPNVDVFLEQQRDVAGERKEAHEPEESLEAIESTSDTDTTTTSNSIVCIDIGNLATENPSKSDIEEYVTKGHIAIPETFPKDINNKPFPESILSFRKVNGEKHLRDWLVWSHRKQALYCLPCRLLWSSVSATTAASPKSALASPEGWPACKKWRKLFDRIPEHERSTGHRECYLAWRELQRRISSGTNIENFLEASIEAESVKWYNVLKRIIDVILFLGQRGLAFRGSSQRIGDSNNGNFLGLIELLSHWDPLLKEHVLRVKESQRKGERLQVHYLSAESQNEFISECSEIVKQRILRERQTAKYFAVIVDATPDSSHVEQTTFLLRYVMQNESESVFEVVERFLTFVDCSDKTGAEIANMIIETLKEHGIPITDCRAQGYDNGANMAGRYNGAQAKVLEVCPTAVFSPCGCHTLNLCGNDAAQSLPEAVTYFGTIQTVYNLFSSSPKRWEILLEHIGSSLHGISDTRWSARVESVKPFAAHLPSIKQALEELLDLNLTPKTRNDINGALAYVTSFMCIIMSAVWYKILIPVEFCNKVIQARTATLDVEVVNIEQLIADLSELRNKWKLIWSEAKTVASNLGIEVKLSRGRGATRRKRPRFHDDDVEPDTDLPEVSESDDSPEEAHFRKFVFYVLLDKVIAGLTIRFRAAKEISERFSFLWNYLTMPPEEVEEKSRSLAEEYPADISQDLVQEMMHLPSVHRANFGDAPLSPLGLLNILTEHKLEGIFTNVCVGLRILLTMPATVASAEQSFSKLKLIKNFLHTTMSQGRLVDLARLSIETDIAKTVDFDSVIQSFAKQKARKAVVTCHGR